VRVCTCVLLCCVLRTSLRQQCHHHLLSTLAFIPHTPFCSLGMITSLANTKADGREQATKSQNLQDFQQKLEDESGKLERRGLLTSSVRGLLTGEVVSDQQAGLRASGADLLAGLGSASDEQSSDEE
jgi:hypothetical protein